jgi:predicted RNA-binding Zn-ribbon protein involved in translation (DUF1610 family)
MEPEKKQPKCPKCGENIDWLKHYQECTVYWIYRKQGRDYSYEEMEVIDGRHSEWACPQCSETIFRVEEDAENFLEGL